MRGENMAKNHPKCCQIAKIFVGITSRKVQFWLLKSLENSGIFAPTLWHFVRPTKFTRIRSYVKLLNDRNTQRAEMPKMFGKMRMPPEKKHSTPR